METQSKPRVTPQQYEEMMKRKSVYVPCSMADLIERFMQENSTGLDATYRYRKLQRDSVIGPMMARALAESDVIEFCQKRIKEVCAATVMHDLVCLTNVLKYAGSGVWKDCLGISAAKVIAAKPFLTRQRLVSKSEPRSRRPTNEEVASLLAYFAKQNEYVGTKIDMTLLTRWQIASSRRVGESCKLLWRDWMPEDRTTVVRGVKDPKRKGKIRTAALPDEASEILWELVYAMNENPELRTDEPRIFPFRSRTASARYTMAKLPGAATPEGIKDLRLHDCRRECASRLSEKGHSSNQIRMVTLHETTVILDRTYNKPNPATFKDIRPAGEDENRRIRLARMTPSEIVASDQSWSL